MGVKSSLYSLISNNRDSRIVQGIHRVTRFVDSAVRNEGSAFEHNGESKVLLRLTECDFRTAVDVGANVGSWTLAAAKTWKACKVHAFEVAPRTTAELMRSVDTHPERSRISVWPQGLSNKPGKLQMYYYPDDPELTSDSPRHEGKTKVPFEADLTTLDDFCLAQQIDAIDFLKIDVEGAEFRVMDGARGMIEGQKVKCIQFEYGAFSVDTRVLLKDYYARLQQHYHLGKIFPGYVDFRDYDWTMEDFRFCNYVCVLRSLPNVKQLIGRRE